MFVYRITIFDSKRTASSRGSRLSRKMLIPGLLLGLLLGDSGAWGQSITPDWHSEVPRRTEKQDWETALRIVDQEISRAPQDMDVRAWRARVLPWSGNLAQAEKEYLEILKVSRNDPDNWMGLANVYLREGRTEEVLGALDVAIQLDPARTDLHAAKARAFRAKGERNKARLEFQHALELDPTSEEARAGLISLRPEAKHE